MMACARDATGSEIVRVLNPRACLVVEETYKKDYDRQTDERVDRQIRRYRRQESLVGRCDRYRCRQMCAVDLQRKDIGCGAD